MFGKHLVWACNTKVDDKNPCLQFLNVWLDTKSKCHQDFRHQGQIGENGGNLPFDLLMKQKYFN